MIGPLASKSYELSRGAARKMSGRAPFEPDKIDWEWFMVARGVQDRRGTAVK